MAARAWPVLALLAYLAALALCDQVAVPEVPGDLDPDGESEYLRALEASTRSLSRGKRFAVVGYFAFIFLLLNTVMSVISSVMARDGSGSSGSSSSSNSRDGMIDRRRANLRLHCLYPYNPFTLSITIGRRKYFFSSVNMATCYLSLSFTVRWQKITLPLFRHKNYNCNGFR